MVEPGLRARTFWGSGIGTVTNSDLLIDGLQYCRWSEKIFDQLRAGGVDAIHATVVYHENYRGTLDRLAEWACLFERFGDRIAPGRTAADILSAQSAGKTAVFFGMQNCKPVEDDPARIEDLYDCGVRFMQLSYNAKSSLATGWIDEAMDEGITAKGREAIVEMNRVGMAVDMSHSAERSTLEAIELSGRPIAITHANPRSWRDTGRNKSDTVLKALADAGGMLGFSLYPHHMKDGQATTLPSFCEMAARAADLMGVEHLGIGSDLCQDQPDSIVRWMRSGVWEDGHTPPPESVKHVRFPGMPDWFRSNEDFPGIARALRETGFSVEEAAGIMGNNWFRFMESAFEPRKV